MLTHVLNLVCGLQKTHFVTYFRLTLSINLRTSLYLLYMHAYLSPKWSI